MLGVLGVQHVCGGSIVVVCSSAAAVPLCATGSVKLGHRRWVKQLMEVRATIVMSSKRLRQETLRTPPHPPTLATLVVSTWRTWRLTET